MTARSRSPFRRARVSAPRTKMIDLSPSRKNPMMIKSDAVSTVQLIPDSSKCNSLKIIYNDDLKSINSDQI